MEVTKKSTDRWVDKEELLPVQMEYELVKKWNNAICSDMDATTDDHAKGSKSERERQIPYDITCVWNLKYGTDEPIYKTETDSQT